MILAEPGCDQAALQRLFQGRTRADVSDQGEPAQQFQRAEHAISMS